MAKESKTQIVAKKAAFQRTKRIGQCGHETIRILYMERKAKMRWWCETCCKVEE